MEKEKVLTELEKKFCLIYVAGPVPYVGNDVRCYQLVFNESTTIPKGEAEIELSIEANELMSRKEIKEYIDKLNAANVVNATSLRPRLTQTLLKIMEECSSNTYEDKFGTPISPAALRAVAVNAASKLTEMYGIKEDIAHTVNFSGGNGDGIIFNLIAPQPAPKAEDELIG